MVEIALEKGNFTMAKRRSFKPRKKARSAAQKAATKRMLAANRGARSASSKPRKTRKKRRSVKRSASRALSRVTSSVKRVSRRASRRRGLSLGGTGSSAVAMLSNAAMQGVGAIGIDIGMGQLAKVLPTGWDSPIDAGGVNYKYYAVKAGFAIGVGLLGRRYVGGKIGEFAMKAAQGSLAVMAYNLGESMLPAGTTLGFSPAYRNPSGSGQFNPRQPRLASVQTGQPLGAPPTYAPSAYRGPV